LKTTNKIVTTEYIDSFCLVLSLKHFHLSDTRM